MTPIAPGGPMEPLSLQRLPSTDELRGTSLALELVAGGRLTIGFDDDAGAEWSLVGTPWDGEGRADVDVVEAGHGVLFVNLDLTDFVRGLEAIAVIVVPARGWALVVHQERFHPEETWSRGPEVRQSFLPARIAGSSQSGDAPDLTRDLVGHRHLYRYSPRNLYEHVYLNSTTMCGHNVSTTGTPGRADCHPATYYRVAEDVYVVGWREYDSAAGMLAVLDMAELQSTGMVLHPEHFLQSVSRPFGGPITALGAATYPAGLEPR